MLHGPRCGDHHVVSDHFTNMHTYLRTSHPAFNLGRYGNICLQFSQAAVAVVGTAVGTVVVAVDDVNVAG